MRRSEKFFHIAAGLMSAVAVVFLLWMSSQILYEAFYRPWRFP